MHTPRESELRDHLAGHLDLIARDLRIIATEFPIPNAVGTRGRIDILAKDGHDSWVVIELKRADGTARQALHEVAKYTELLRREKGIRQDRIRAIIVSTTWDELLIPVSNFARDWSHNLRGYRLLLRENGVPVGADEVEFLSPVPVPEVTPIHFIFFFNTERERERGWQQVVNRAVEAGANDLLAADFQRVRELERVRAPLGLYFALGRMDPVQVPASIKAAAAESEEAPGYELEYEALCHITRHVFGEAYEPAGPGMWRQIQEDGRWRTQEYRSAGAFGKRSMLSQHDLSRDLNGDNNGIVQVRFSGSARTTDRGRWRAFLKEYTPSLSCNVDWARMVDQWLTDIAAISDERDVALHVYNPCDLVGTIVHGWPDKLQLVEPMLLGFALSQSGAQRVIRGGIYWNGRPIPDFEARVRRVYRDPLDWMIACISGENRLRDAELLESLGLRYMLFERVSDSISPSNEDGIVAIWTIIGESVTLSVEPFEELRADGWSRGAYPLSDFLEEHQAQISALVSTYRRQVDVPDLPLPERGDEVELLAKFADDEPVIVKHAVPDGSSPLVSVADLADCSVPAEKRVPTDLVADSLTKIAQLGRPGYERKLAIQVCSVQGGAAATSASWLLEMLGELHPDLEVVPDGSGVPNIAKANRSDYIVGTCYLVGLVSLPIDIRRRAAVQLVAFCHDTGYVEARRLLREKNWAWLPSALNEDSWARLLAVYVIEDEMISSEAREAIRIALRAT